MKLFVRNLSYQTTEDELREFFEAVVGKVESVKIIMDRFTGKSRGFGFVEMSNNDQGNKAISELNGQELDGREVVVDVAKDKERRPSRDSGQRSRY